MFGRLVLILLCLGMVGCETPAYQEQGWASSIIDHYGGRMTSSGQMYHPGYSMAAHNTLPFGTELTVENLATGRRVQVRVNDRFPSYPGLVISLSASAAQYIGMSPRQLSPVRLTAYTIPRGGYGAAARSHVPQPVPDAASRDYARRGQLYGGNEAPRPLAPAHVMPSGARQDAPVAFWSSFFRRLRGGRTPNAESYRGGNTPPAQLPLF